jgi:hypothetical protein
MPTLIKPVSQVSDPETYFKTKASRKYLSNSIIVLMKLSKKKNERRSRNFKFLVNMKLLREK